MNISKLVPPPNNKVSFTLSTHIQVPKTEGCYVLATADNSILYVGLAKNLYKRFLQHLDNPEKVNPTKNGKAIWFYFSSFDKGNLPLLERTWLNQYLTEHGQLPILNKVNPPVS